jgi:DNA-binding NtrC family response regulator
VNDYFKIPFDYPDLLTSIRRHLPSPSAAVPAAQLIGASASMGTLKDFLSKVAAADSTVLVTGETGTSKELAATLIHRQSRRRQRPLVSVNCAPLPEGLVESELFGHTRGAFTGALAERLVGIEARLGRNEIDYGTFRRDYEQFTTQVEGFRADLGRFTSRYNDFSSR